MSLRSQAVKKARRKGICTQCLKNKAEKCKRQCTRCININRRKFIKRKMREEGDSMAKELAQRLRQYRADHYLTQKAMADKIGVHKDQYKRWEHDTVPNNESLAKIDKLLASAPKKKDRSAAMKRHWANKKAREQALGGKDPGQPKRKWQRKLPEINPLLMQSLVSELELFIQRLPNLTATEYLEERERVIKTIVVKGSGQ